MKSRLFIIALFLIFAAACSSTPTPPPRPLPAATAALSADAHAIETTIAQRVSGTLTAGAPSTPSNSPGAEPSLVATVTPPSFPTPISTEVSVSPTLALALSPSITPLPALPTQFTTRTPTPVPTKTPLVVSREALRGKILFRSARNKGKFPSGFQYFVMDADGSNTIQLEKDAGTRLYNELKPLEGYSPDKSLLVIGERTCGGTGRCDLYIGPPEVIANRSQGQWTPSGRYRAYDPAWSPADGWIAFVWTRDLDHTKNIFKGIPTQSNQDFKRLTDFGGGRDTKDPTYSPDGSLLAFATQDGPRWQIWILNPLADNFTEANPHSLSNSQSDDWAPVWIK